MSKFVTEITEFKGNKVLNIYGFDKQGNKFEKPLISFGRTKAIAILECLEEVKELAVIQSEQGSFNEQDVPF